MMIIGMPLLWSLCATLAIGTLLARLFAPGLLGAQKVSARATACGWVQHALSTRAAKTMLPGSPLSTPDHRIDADPILHAATASGIQTIHTS